MGPELFPNERPNMAAVREIETEEQWEALPVGSLAKVYCMEIDDQGVESDTLTVFVTRVEGDTRANIGDYWLAGGKWWSDVWVWQQGVIVVDAAEVLVDPVFGPNELPEDPVAAAEEVLRAAAVERATPEAVVGKLLDLGWQPPAAVLEGTQVWTITGTPAKVHHMNGTQAYLSLPNGPETLLYEDWGDIVLDNPVITVVNERVRD
jgi:hypothetical protein